MHPYLRKLFALPRGPITPAAEGAPPAVTADPSHEDLLFEVALAHLSHIDDGAAANRLIEASRARGIDICALSTAFERRAIEAAAETLNALLARIRKLHGKPEHSTSA